MNEITQITQTETSTRIFCIVNHLYDIQLFFVEDLNKSLINVDVKQVSKINK